METQSVPYIRSVIVNALQGAGQLTGLQRDCRRAIAAVAAVPSAAAQTVTTSLPGAEADGAAHRRWRR